MSRTALWNLKPLAAADYPADWQPVAAAKATALRSYPNAREIVRAQLRTMLAQVRAGLERSHAHGPAERKTALEFLNGLDLTYRAGQ